MEPTRRSYNFYNGVNIIGLMSGTSLDGLDICLARFYRRSGVWSYKTIVAEDEEYPTELKHSLSIAQSMSALDYARLHSDYGLYLGGRIRAFMERNGIKSSDVAVVASHGQTIFHQPMVRFTGQIGCGAGIAATSGVDCICDFRTTDVALGGQGAPLVPIGDRNLFGNYDFCLNLGGFSNISFDSVISKTERVAYDICPVNYVLNHYAREVGLDFDRDGELARGGRVCQPLIEAIDALPFYSSSGPKSLGREWVEREVFPLIDAAKESDGKPLSLSDKLATFCEHVAHKIADSIVESRKAGMGCRVLVTGGGALNKYLIERMRGVTRGCEFVIPDIITVKFKEALIFAFLGALYLADEPNCLSSVTGAKCSSIGGAMYKSPKC